MLFSITLHTQMTGTVMPQWRHSTN